MNNVETISWKAFYQNYKDMTYRVPTYRLGQHFINMFIKDVDGEMLELLNQSNIVSAIDQCIKLIEEYQWDMEALPIVNRGDVMLEPKPCSQTGQTAQKFTGYKCNDLFGCCNQECNYRNRPQQLEDCNNCPYENEIKTEAIKNFLIKEAPYIEFCSDEDKIELSDIILQYERERLHLAADKLKRD